MTDKQLSERQKQDIRRLIRHEAADAGLDNDTTEAVVDNVMGQLHFDMTVEDMSAVIEDSIQRHANP